MSREWKILAAFLGVFLLAYLAPLATPRFDAQADPLAAKITGAIVEALLLLQWYARNHTLACVVPALFIAGAITTFLSKEAVLKHLGPKANKVEAYSVASVSGTVLAVCSCSVLPMFAGIYRIGAGLGPAACFLYAGPAINVLAIFLTARVLGFELGVARVVGAMVFGVVIGLIMALLFRTSEDERSKVTLAQPDPPAARRPLWQNASLLAAMLALLVFSDWFNPGDKVVQLADGQRFEATLQYETENSLDLRLKRPALGREASEVVRLAKADVASMTDVDTWVTRVHHYRWWLAGAMGVLVAAMSLAWLNRQDFSEWMGNTWEFSKLLLPLLFGGVFVVGFLGALIPEKEVASLVGDNSMTSNLIASVVGCVFYFATLTEVPILEALMRNGMHHGPALALLLAGPALSLPSILVIRSVVGYAKTAAFVALVVVMATIAGMGFGEFYPSTPAPITPAATTSAAPPAATVVAVSS
ncbi:putative permease [Posidoniimonas polymericola]|uniref:Putative permease n=1 Tax=Posidoniimonas polymericola TaxID=2528002 RepID=A0A5C5YI98_9BACT|nr:permease [Posidoniimonas polymericola]TWT74590.1 putative permease [Posidoniimonas polymericola]